MLDVGVNVEVSVFYFLDFVIMGWVCVMVFFYKEDLKVGLFNIGLEDLKGYLSI